jgi:hypothetical protein
MAIGQRIGKVFIKMDGNLLESMPGAKLTLGGVDRKTIKGSNTILGFAEAPAESQVECEIAGGTNTKLDTFRNATNVTLTFVPDVGPSYLVSNAWNDGAISVSDGEGGKIGLKFNGPPAQEIAS